jgi:squalene synthase HpnC
MNTATPHNLLNSVQHYENFPVASWLLPKHCVPAVQALYRFARAADDLADEGDATPEQRLDALATLYAELEHPARASTALVLDLAPFIADGSVSKLELQKLLSAFSQDAAQDGAPDEPRHADFASLLNYCARSANPVGRMMLKLTRSPCTHDTEALSDDICTALQLINFWQDIAKDALRGRSYVPMTTFRSHAFPINSADPNYRSMMQTLCNDARVRMAAGTPLLKHLSGRFKAEIALTIAGGLRVLDKLHAANYAVQNPPIRLTLRDSLPIAGSAIKLMLKYRKA